MSDKRWYLVSYDIRHPKRWRGAYKQLQGRGERIQYSLFNETPEGGYQARALGESIFTEADDLESLHVHVRDAVQCHFEQNEAPKIIRLHFVREEVIAL